MLSLKLFFLVRKHCKQRASQTAKEVLNKTGRIQYKCCSFYSGHIIKAIMLVLHFHSFYNLVSCHNIKEVGRGGEGGGGSVAHILAARLGATQELPTNV